MNPRSIAVLGWVAAATLATTSISLAQAPSTAPAAVKPPMQMHKAEMDHSKMADPQVAAEFKTEATTLREKAVSHRELSASYKARLRGAGKIDYSQLAKHCDKLAQFYDDAAKEADAVASGLSKP